MSKASRQDFKEISELVIVERPNAKPGSRYVMYDFSDYSVRTLRRFLKERTVTCDEKLSVLYLYAEKALTDNALQNEINSNLYRLLRVISDARPREAGKVNDLVNKIQRYQQQILSALPVQ